MGHLGYDEAMEAGGRELHPRPGHYSRTSFQSNQATGTVFSSEYAFFPNSEFILEYCPRGKALNYKPSAPFFYQLTRHVKLLFRPCYCY